MNDDAALQYTPVDLSDTLRPPPLPRDKRTHPLKRQHRELEALRRGIAQSYPVTVRCETEEQRAMLVDWLAEQGFDVEPKP